MPRIVPTLEALNTACASCNLRELCLPIGLSAAELERLDTLVERRRKVARGAALFRTGDAFDALFAVHTGFFKTCVISERAADDGREQVTGFQMAGELLGLEAISRERHACNAVALEDSQVCVIPYRQLEALARDVPALQQAFHKVMSREIVRDHGVIQLLGGKRAEERVAAFLLNLAGRLQARGFSAAQLVLRMTREEIGSYLGLKLETVSRTFSRLQAEGLLEVRQRAIRILDEPRLRHLIEHASG